MSAIFIMLIAVYHVTRRPPNRAARTSSFGLSHLQRGAVHGQCFFGTTPPRKLGRAVVPLVDQRRPQTCIARQRKEGTGQPIDVGRYDQSCRITHNLGQ
jgi:hypothetical protein